MNKEKVRIYFMGIPKWIPSIMARLYAFFGGIILLTILYPIWSLCNNFNHLLDGYIGALKVIFLSHDKRKPAKNKKVIYE